MAAAYGITVASTATYWLFDIKVSEFYTGEAAGVTVTGAATGAGAATTVAVTVTGAPLTAAA